MADFPIPPTKVHKDKREKRQQEKIDLKKERITCQRSFICKISTKTDDRNDHFENWT